MSNLAAIPADLADRLAEPFEASEVKFKPQVVKGNRAMATVYIDARLVMDRLDEVFGVGGWQDEYTPLDNGSVMCRLSVLVGGGWVVKCDVGSESEQPDGGDRLKAAFSDALKRAAVKLGVGRYLYRIPSGWHEYDPQKRQFVGRPPLPAWALPTAKAARRQPDAPYAEPEPIPLTAAPDETPAKKATPAKAKPKADPQTAAEVYAALSNVTIEDGAKLSRCFDATAKKLASVADFPAVEFRAALTSFLKVKPDIDLASLPAKDRLPAWNFVKQTVKRFADAASANPQPKQAP